MLYEVITGFGDQRVGDQGRFDFHRTHAVTGDVQHVVDTTGDGEITGFRVTDRAVASRITSYNVCYTKLLRVCVGRVRRVTDIIDLVVVHTGDARHERADRRQSYNFV